MVERRRLAKMKTKDTGGDVKPVTSSAALADKRKQLEAAIAALRARVESDSTIAALLETKKRLEAEVEALDARYESDPEFQAAAAKEAQPMAITLKDDKPLTVEERHDLLSRLSASLAAQEASLLRIKELRWPTTDPVAKMFAWFSSPLPVDGDWFSRLTGGRR